MGEAPRSGGRLWNLRYQLIELVHRALKVQVNQNVTDETLEPVV